MDILSFIYKKYKEKMLKIKYRQEKKAIAGIDKSSVYNKRQAKL